MDHPLSSPALAQADFWLFPELKSVLKAKRSSDLEDIKSSVKKGLHIFMFRILKTVLNNGRSAGNIIKNWREIILKNSMLQISAALNIIFFFKIGLESYLPFWKIEFRIQGFENMQVH
jgi:hypothetical protein